MGAARAAAAKEYGSPARGDRTGGCDAEGGRASANRGSDQANRGCACSAPGDKIRFRRTDTLAQYRLWNDGFEPSRVYPQGSNVTYKDDRTVLSDVPVIEGCEAKVNILHAAGAVKEIVMRGEGHRAGRCSLRLIAACQESMANLGKG